MLKTSLLTAFLAFWGTYTTAFVVESQGNLTVDLFNKLGSETDNVLFSPSSIFYGLAMLYWGMDGTTKQSVGRALELPSDDQEFRDAIKTLTTKSEGSPL